MTDKELIEAAARAMGYTGYWMEDKFHLNGPRTWNPLTSDADCARMEVELEIDVSWLPRHKAVNCGNIDFNVGKTELYDTDKAAARRRASTRVAAEIGKRKL